MFINSKNRRWHLALDCYVSGFTQAQTRTVMLTACVVLSTCNMIDERINDPLCSVKALLIGDHW